MGSVVHRNSANLRMQGSPKRQQIHFNDVTSEWATLINITREQVQAIGRGARTIFNPGDISAAKPGPGMAVQILRRKNALQMYQKKRAFLKGIPLKKGQELYRLAKELEKGGSSDPFFVALGRMYPQFAKRSEIDIARETRELASLRTRFKQKYGAPPEPEWTREFLMAKMQDATRAFESDPGWLADGDTSLDLSDLDDIDVPEATAPVQDVHYDGDDLPDEPEQGPDIPSLEVAKQRVVQSDDAERASILRQLHARGMRPHGRTGTDKLRDLLAKAIAREPVKARG